jgi:hypothetical protein
MIPHHRMVGVDRVACARGVQDKIVTFLIFLSFFS